MGNAQREARSMSRDEYLAFEAGSETRHEFVDGFVYAMTGASKRHNRIVGRVYARLLSAERGSGCRAYIEAVQLRLRDRIYYPDVMVACGPPTADQRSEEAPSVLVEVLSDSTWQIDRREKLGAYRAIPSLQTYLVIAQDERYVHWHSRATNGVWQHELLVDTGVISVPTLGVAMTLDEIYEGIELGPPGQSLRIRELEQAYGGLASAEAHAAG
jgi:Uma2 family endonuclease